MMSKEQQISAFLQIFERGSRVRGIYKKSGPSAAYKSLVNSHGRYFPDVTLEDFQFAAADLMKEKMSREGVQVIRKAGKVVIIMDEELLNGSGVLIEKSRRGKASASKLGHKWLGIFSQLVSHTGIKNRAELSKRFTEKLGPFKDGKEKIAAAKRVLSGEVKL